MEKSSPRYAEFQNIKLHIAQCPLQTSPITHLQVRYITTPQCHMLALHYTVLSNSPLTGDINPQSSN